MDGGLAKAFSEWLSKEPVLKGNWSKRTLEIWLRDDCRCVYCGRKMLESRDTCYYFWCAEHLLPVKKYPFFKNEIWNQVLACKPCNALKQNFDPAGEGIPGNEDHRGELIKAASIYIDKRRAEVEELFFQEVKILSGALSARAASAP